MPGQPGYAGGSGRSLGESGPRDGSTDNSRNNPLLFVDPSGHVAIQQAQALCAAEGLSCENLTHDMAVELLNGNAKWIDWTDPSVLTSGSPVDIVLFVAFSVGLPEDEGGITITKAALAHVLERHSVGGSMTMGKSVFLAGEDIVKLVRDAKAVTPVKQQVGKYFERIIDAGRPIGTDRVTGTATSIYTVITNAAKELVTAFPGTP